MLQNSSCSLMMEQSLPSVDVTFSLLSERGKNTHNTLLLVVLWDAVLRDARASHLDEVLLAEAGFLCQ